MERRASPPVPKNASVAQVRVRSVDANLGSDTKASLATSSATYFAGIGAVKNSAAAIAITGEAKIV